MTHANRKCIIALILHDCYGNFTPFSLVNTTHALGQCVSEIGWKNLVNAAAAEKARLEQTVELERAA